MPRLGVEVASRRCGVQIEILAMVPQAQGPGKDPNSLTVELLQKSQCWPAPSLYHYQSDVGKMYFPKVDSQFSIFLFKAQL